MDSWFTILLASITALVASLVTWLTGRRTGRASEITAEAAAEKSAADVWKEVAEGFKKDVIDVKGELEKLRNGQKELEKQLKVQSEQEMQTRGDLNAVFLWIEGGMQPPPPERPIYLTKERRPWSPPE